MATLQPTSPPVSSSWTWKSPVLTDILLAVVYFIAGKLGLQLAFVHPSATPIWAPTGIALAAFLVLGYRVWPAILVGAFLVNLTTMGSITTSLGIAAGNTLEGLVGAYLVNRFANGRHVFYRPRDVFKWAILSAGASTTLSATCGVTCLALGGYVAWTDYASIWVTWWLGDAAGDLIVAPVLVLWWSEPSRSWKPGQAHEAGLMLLAFILVGVTIFGGLLPNYPLAFLCMPLLVWVAFRFGQRETTTATLGISAIAIWGTLHGFGPFFRESPNESLLFVQAFSGVLAMVALAVSAAVAVGRDAKESLGDREERLRFALEAARMGAWEWHIASGSVHWSASLEELHGLVPGTFGGTLPSYVAMIHPEDREIVAHAIERAVKHGEDFRLEYRMVRLDGTIHWVEGRGRLVHDDTGTPVRMLGVCIDIEERRRAQEARFHWAAIVESSNDAIIGATLKGRIISWNPAAERLFGYSAEEVQGQPMSLLIPPERRVEELSSILVRIKQGERNVQFETVCRRKDAQSIEVSLTVSPINNADGVMTGGSTIARDISERRRAEEALREREQRYKRLLESITDYIYHVKVENGLALATSHGPGSVAVTGYASADYDADPFLWYRMVHEQDRQTVLDRAEKVLAGEVPPPLEHRLIHKDGAVRWIKNTAVPHRDEQGRLVAYHGLISDITERMRVEQRLGAEHAVARVLAESATLADAAPGILRFLCECLEWDVGLL